MSNLEMLFFQFGNMLFSATLALYVIAVVLHFSGLGFKNELMKKLGHIVFIVAAALHFIYFCWRWYVVGYLPMANQFEFGMSFALGIAVCYLIMRSKMPWMVSVGMPAVLIMMAYASTRNMDVRDLMPVLRSPWFAVHIATAVVAYAAFALAACAGIKYLWMLKKGEKEDNPLMVQIDHVSYRLVGLGMLFFTVVILSGSLWAVDAWSAFWSWDPKELWSLITWVVYAIYLHQRLRKGWRGKRTAILAIFAIGVVLFTYIGVNTFLPGLHSYA
jgi:cytochrome c-type biogenesis protein CcsB